MPVNTPRLADYLPASLMAVLGLVFVMWLSVTPQSGAAHVAAVFAPWDSKDEALGKVADLQVPILDIGWGGRLITVDVGGDPAARALLARHSLLLLRPDLGPICAEGP